MFSKGLGDTSDELVISLILGIEDEEVVVLRTHPPLVSESDTVCLNVLESSFNSGVGNGIDGIVDAAEGTTEGTT